MNISSVPGARYLRSTTHQISQKLGDSRWPLSRDKNRGLFPVCGNPAKPALDVAGRANKVILQTRLGQSAIPRPPGPVSSDQFTDRSFDAGTPLHLLSKGVGL